MPRILKLPLMTCIAALVCLQAGCNQEPEKQTTQLLAEAASDEKQRVVPDNHPDKGNRQRHRILGYPPMSQEAACQQRYILRQRQAQSAQEQHAE